MTKEKIYKSEKKYELIRKRVKYAPLDWLQKKYPKVFKYVVIPTMYFFAVLSLLFISLLGWSLLIRGNLEKAIFDHI